MPDVSATHPDRKHDWIDTSILAVKLIAMHTTVILIAFWLV